MLTMRGRDLASGLVLEIQGVPSALSVEHSRRTAGGFLIYFLNLGFLKQQLSGQTRQQSVYCTDPRVLVRAGGGTEPLSDSPGVRSAASPRAGTAPGAASIPCSQCFPSTCGRISQPRACSVLLQTKCRKPPQSNK